MKQLYEDFGFAIGCAFSAGLYVAKLIVDGLYDSWFGDVESDGYVPPLIIQSEGHTDDSINLKVVVNEDGIRKEREEIN